MALFAKNKPTKRVEFEGGWVELQHLSKGVKDDIQNKIIEACKGIDLKKIDSLKNKSSEEMPDDIPFEIVGKINETSYIALKNAIKAWSEADTPITIEAVRDLDEDIFEKILTEVNQMNQLQMGERKN